MSFRRRKSRIGPGFQAIIPELLTIKQKQELKKVYDYEQSLAEHCLTISSLSGHITINNMNNLPPPHPPHPSHTSQYTQPTQSTNQHQQQQQKYSIHDTNIDHRIDPICWDASKSIVPPTFNYQRYRNQYTQKPNQSLQQKLSKFQQKFSSNMR